MRTEDNYFILVYIRFIFATFAISWLIWTPLAIFPNLSYLSKLWIAVLGLYGPSIAGILLSFRFQGVYWQHYIPNWKIFTLVFLFSSFIGIKYMLKITPIVTTTGPTLTGLVILLILVSSFITAYLLTLMMESPPGFETKNKSPMQIQSQIGMLLFALILPLIVGIIATFVFQSFNLAETYTVLTNRIIGPFTYPFYLIFYSFLFSGATNEEIGWRGYFTPKLLQRLSPLNSGLIIGITWSVWHLPLHLTQFYSGGMEAFWLRLLWNIPLGIVFTWYYIRSDYNLLGAIILHGAFNMFSNIGSKTLIPAYIIAALIMIVESKMWINDYNSKK